MDNYRNVYNMRLWGVLIFVSQVYCSASSQTSNEVWSLRRCIDTAIVRNVTIRQAENQIINAHISYIQAKFGQIPTAEFSAPLGYQFGRTINPITNSFTSLDLVYQSSTINGYLTVVDWGELRKLVKVQEYDYKASVQSRDKVKKDVSLTITSYYLQALLSKGQWMTSELQLGLTGKQLEVTIKRFNGGTLPPLAVSQMRVQLASDSIEVITNKANYEVNLLYLKSAVNIPLNIPFEIDSSEIIADIPDISSISPEQVYREAIGNQPQMKLDLLNIRAAEMNEKATKYALYPYLTFNYSLGTDFSNYTSGEPFKHWWDGYSSQLNYNGSQIINLTLNIPISNGGHLHAAVQQAKTQLQSSKLQQEQDMVQLQQNIYIAYINASHAFQKLTESKVMCDESKKVYDYTYKGYQMGTFDAFTLIEAQNSLLRADIQRLTNLFDYYLRMEILNFYRTD